MGVRHAESARLLDGFVGERCCRDSYRRYPAALQVYEVMQTARRARTSIGEGFHDEVGMVGDLIDQREGRGLGEDFLDAARR
jgi:hypothetical protein